MFQLQLFFLLHCNEWNHVVALPRHKFVTGATLLQLDFYSASSLDQQTAGRLVAPLEHIIMLRANQFLFFLNASCLAEKQQIQML